MSFIPLRLAAGVSLLKNRGIQRRVQATVAALILSRVSTLKRKHPSSDRTMPLAWTTPIRGLPNRPSLTLRCSITGGSGHPLAYRWSMRQAMASQLIG